MQAYARERRGFSPRATAGAAREPGSARAPAGGRRRRPDPAPLVDGGGARRPRGKRRAAPPGRRWEYGSGGLQPGRNGSRDRGMASGHQDEDGGRERRQMGLMSLLPADIESSKGTRGGCDKAAQVGKRWQGGRRLGREGGHTEGGGEMQKTDQGRRDQGVGGGRRKRGFNDHSHRQ